jgi:hypothetical protein
LTVEDSHHATNSTTANITVLKVTDYPPEANAGQDIIIYLPRNNLTLDGSLSTDDRGIAIWEWTKSPSDQDKAVDMQVEPFFYIYSENCHVIADEIYKSSSLSSSTNTEIYKSLAMSSYHMHFRSPSSHTQLLFVSILLLNIY